ncbi:hypothetical protein ACWD2L_35460, partial [Streptomyces sp. NPDC002754]
GKFGGGAYAASGGLHGVGASVVRRQIAQGGGAVPRNGWGGGLPKAGASAVPGRGPGSARTLGV